MKGRQSEMKVCQQKRCTDSNAEAEMNSENNMKETKYKCVKN